MSTTSRTRLDPAQRRSALLSAARELALSQGLAAVTMRSVAARAGVTPGLVLHYAGTMDDLVADVFGGIVRDELDELEALVGEVSSADARLDLLLDALLDASRATVTAVWVQSWALGGSNPSLAARVRSEMDAWHGFIRALVAAVSTVDADAAAAQILGMIDGINAHALVRWRSPEERRQLLVRAVAAMLGRSSEDQGP
jgi:AcrR family transcriptional regulator